MTDYPSDAEARVALHEVERARLRVIDEIGMPRWYWWGLAGCWIALGVLSDVADPWITVAATVVFGAVHSAVSQRLLAGRRRTGDLKVRADVVGRRAPLLVFGCLVGLAGITVAAALAANADGARHPATMASVLVAVAILLGGPALMAWIRAGARRAALQ